MAPNNELLRLQRMGDELFIAPYAMHDWETTRARVHWTCLEWWQDCLAGPLTSIAQAGGCRYVYPREDEYFTGINDPDSLREWMREAMTHLDQGVDQFVPANPSEAIDLEYMKSLVAGMRLLIDQAMQVEQAR